MNNGKSQFFRRKAYDRMLEWKKRSNGRTALLIEGARRVGKSTLVKQFATKEYKTHIVIDFYKAQKDILALFDDLSNLDKLFRDLQALTGVDFHRRETVIVFDEVQLFPRARGAIKALVEDGRYDYIETGSLISIKKNVKDIIIPSEEEHLTLHPMDFEEFLWTQNDNSFEKMSSYLRDRIPLEPPIHKKMLSKFREYISVGGMPQVVSLYVNGENYTTIDIEKRSIISLYLDDFKKIDPSGSMGRCFSNIPSSLSSESNRYRPPSRDARNLDKKISEMEDSKTVVVCGRVSDPRVGLNMTVDSGVFKLFMEDTGLFVTLCFIDHDPKENVIYKKLINGKLPANLGYVYENVVCQSLTSSGHIARYHTFRKEDKKHEYEIDFIIADMDSVIPIEVKSSKVSQHISMDKFLEKRRKDVKKSYIVSEKNYHEEGKIVFLPIYMVGLI